jgi:hypothetical protein
MAARIRARTPVSSCPGCLSWGPSYGSCSYCRACYDFVARYPRAVCTGCRRLIAVKKGHCRLCWLQAAIVAEGRPRITAQDFRATRYRQLSLAGLTRLGHTGPPAETVQDEPIRPPAGTDQMQLKLFPLGESWLAGRRHWVASTITNEALELTRRIAGELGEIRGWSPRIVIETNRALWPSSWPSTTPPP